MDLGHFKYTFAHKKAFLKVEKALLGKNAVMGYLHDTDKLIMYLIPFVTGEQVSEFHRLHSKHHIPNAIVKDKYKIQAIIDWECSRFTKPDKPYNARQTLYKYYKEYELHFLYLLDRFNL